MEIIKIMKKFIIICFLVFFTNSLFSQVKNLESQYFNSCINDSWSGWQVSHVYVQWNPLVQQIIIYSQQYQIIKYDNLLTEQHSKYTLYSGNAIDKYKKSLNIYFQIFFDGYIYLTLEYKDYSYSYALRQKLK